MVSVQDLRDIANVLRRDSLKMTSAAESGHPTSCLSAAEIMSVLFFHEMRFDVKDSDNPDNDEFILSKGHAAPILYSCLKNCGAIKDDLMKLRQLNSDLEGHLTPRLKWIKVATGSLGQGASVGVGMALASKLSKRKYRTYVLMGDSESSEGSFYEALQLASYYKLDNLCIVLDLNRLGQRGETMLGHSIKGYVARFKSFDFHVESVDGHEVMDLRKAFASCKRIKKPSVIIAKTLKGKGVSFLEDKNGWHGKALSERDLERALGEIPEKEMPKVEIRKPEKNRIERARFKKADYENYDLGESVATRDAYGDALALLAIANPRIIAVDAEVNNSTRAEEVKKVKPRQFVEGFVAEQNMVGMCLGLSKKGFDVFGSTFGAFLSRAHDQIRMASLSKGNFVLCGSHCGVSIGKDGASQMALEDISMMRSVPSSKVLYPCDAVSCEKLVYLATEIEGIKYIRTTRGATPVLYDSKEEFKLGDFKVLKGSKNDKAVLVGSGITVHECLKAYEEVGNVAVVDLYCVKPFDRKKFEKFVKEHGKRVVVVEDHYPEGGIGEMISEVLNGAGFRVDSLAVQEIPHSGESGELLEKYGIDAKSIIKLLNK